MTVTAAGYLHALRGRLRVKVPEVKGSSATARRVEARLRTLAAVWRAEANPLTGNVLVLWDPRHAEQPDVLAELRALGCLGTPPVARSMAPEVGADGRELAAHVAHTVLRAAFEVAVQRMLIALI